MAKSRSKLGDTRLERVQSLIIHAMSKKMTVVLRKLSDNKAQENAFGRYINNSKVNPEGIVAHYHTIERHDFSAKHLLIVQDTSTDSFGLHCNRKGLGYVGENTQSIKFYPGVVKKFYKKHRIQP